MINSSGAAVDQGRILVVEDNHFERALLAASLKQKGYQVWEVCNGREALAFLAQNECDIVLLDLLMPEVDGYQVLNQINQDAALCRLPVIVVSAVNEVESAIRCISMGATDYLLKPLDPVLLQARLNTSLANKRLRDREQAYLKQIEDNHSQLQALIASSRDGLVMINQSGLVRVANAPAIQILHLSGLPEDWDGEHFAHILRSLHHHSPEAARALVAEIRRFAKGYASSSGEFEIGGRFIRWLNLPVMVTGTLIGRLFVLRDVTEERSLEKMREDLTGTLVHDLRSPLANIRTSLELLIAESSGFNAYQHELVDVARSCTTRMIDLVNAILDLSELESGQVPLKRQMTSLPNLGLETLLLQAPVAQEKSLSLQDELPDDLPLVSVDESLIRRVLQNLIGNAVKFTPSGGVIRLKMQAYPTNITVSISDNGPGIAPALRERLFQKFAAGRVEGRGNGLGLAFCRLVVEAHGGRIWAESEPGKGSIFYFSLPTGEI